MKFATIIAGASAHNLSQDLISAEEYAFMGYITKYGRSYATKSEYSFRLAQFTKRVAEHKRWNSTSGQTSSQGVNHLTDRTDAEIAKLNGYRRSNKYDGERVKKIQIKETDGPVDWREKGAVTQVKDQG